MADFKIKQGYSIPIAGNAKDEISQAKTPAFVGVCPTDFKGVKPKLLVKVDDVVKIGSPIFIDKANPDTIFVSPASGRISAINYGPRRVVEEVVIATDGKNDSLEVEHFEKSQISKLPKDKLIDQLLAGGLWPHVRQRPFEKIAKPTDSPKSIFVNCMDTAPLANDPNFSLKSSDEAFSAGIEALKVLCKRIHVAVRHRNPHTGFTSVQGVNIHTFSGEHPSGLVGTHISKIDPISKGEIVWYLTARDLVMIGSFLLTGKYPVERTIALVGNGVSNPRYIRTQTGVKIKDLAMGEVKDGEMRFISGTVLAGTQRKVDSPIGFYDDTLTVIPEGREQHFLGWMMPGFKVPSFTRVFVSGFSRGKKYEMNTNLNGGKRAIIQSGMYEKVVALDLHPEFLIKAAIAQDIDAMERLGILECAPEDFALCTYVCPSKTEVSKIIEEGLDLMEKEG